MGNNKILLIIVLVVIVLAGGYYGYTKIAKEEAGDGYMLNNQDADDTTNGDEAINQELEAGQIIDDQTSGDEIAEAVKEFEVEGNNFTFSLKQIKVQQGDKVKIVFKNIEGFHDLIIDEFAVNTGQIRAGESKTVEFTADKAGTFEYYCSVGQHRANGMFGQLIVE